MIASELKIRTLVDSLQAKRFGVFWSSARHRFASSLLVKESQELEQDGLVIIEKDE